MVVGNYFHKGQNNGIILFPLTTTVNIWTSSVPRGNGVVQYPQQQYCGLLSFIKPVTDPGVYSLPPIRKGNYTLFNSCKIFIL